MSTSVFTPRADNRDNGSAGSWVSRRGSEGSAGRLPDSRRRRAPYLVLGALLVLVCATGFAVAVTHLDHRRAVLALARPVTVGQVLTTGDVREVNVVPDAGMAVMPGAQTSSVVGQTMALSLPAGALLTPAELGQAATPRVGQAIVAQLMKPGQFPPNLAAGAHVLLIPATTGASSGSPEMSTPTSTRKAAGSGWAAIVTDVQTLGNDQGSVLSLQLADTQARQVAAAGSLNVVVVAAGGH